MGYEYCWALKWSEASNLRLERTSREELFNVSSSKGKTGGRQGLAASADLPWKEYFPGNVKGWINESKMKNWEENVL